MTRIDQAGWAARMRVQMDFEWKRSDPPEGFPALPPLATGRYTDPAFHALERAQMWKRSWPLAGRDEGFEEPGSFRRFDRTGPPLLIVRGLDGPQLALCRGCHRYVHDHETQCPRPCREFSRAAARS